jgi:hypothetical protein
MLLITMTKPVELNCGGRMKTEYLYTNQEVMRNTYSHSNDERLTYYIFHLYTLGVIDKSEEVIIGDWIYTWENDNDS